MKSLKPTPLKGLYAITDETLMPESRFAEMLHACLPAASVLQYRDKSANHEKRRQQAQLCRQLCDEYGALLIINDDIELARETKADGVHIGKDDQSLQQARDVLGDDSIIGVSCYDQLELALKADSEGADYIAFGSFFSSNIKPQAPRASIELISRFKQQSDTPLCCIGGITRSNHRPLLDAGADMLAVISDIFGQTSSASIEQAARHFQRSFKDQG